MSKKKDKRKEKKAQQQQRKQQSKKTSGVGLLSKPNLIPLLIILAVTALAFIPSINNEFTNWDDDLYVTDNPYLVSLSAENIKAIFTIPVSGNYNPLTMFSFAIERALFGLNPTPYHINNLILHLICTGLVFWLMLLLRLPLLSAALAAMLFGIHPMRVESVAWVTERKDVLFAMFYVAALIQYILYITKDKGRQKHFVLVLIFFFLSLLSKIQAVALPLSLLAIDYYFNRPLKFNLILEKIPHFGLSLLFGLLGVYFLGERETLQMTENYSLIDRLTFGAYGFSAYVIKALAPLKLSTLYPYPDKVGSMLPGYYYLAHIFVVLTGVFIWKSLKWGKDVAFGFAFFFVNVIFVLQILGAGEAFMVDRFTYVPYIGLFFIMAKGFQYLLETRHQQKGLIQGAALVFLALLTIGTFVRCSVWKNSETLWTDVIDQYPNRAPVAYNNRGTYYRSSNQDAKALADFNKAIIMKPSYYLAYTNRGNVYFFRNENEKALVDYNKALQLRPTNDKALCNRGAIYVRQGKFDQAEVDLDKALSINPHYPDAYMNRGVMYSIRGENASKTTSPNSEQISQLFTKAKDNYTSFLKYKESSQVRNWRGIAYNTLQQPQNALKDFNRAIQLNGKNGEYYYNRSISYQQMGNTAQAQQDAQKAKSLGYAK